MTTHWPVIDYIGMVEEINAAYKLSHEPKDAAICYSKCEDLLAQIPNHGYFFIAHTHIILALLALSKDPLTPQTHLQTALHQFHTLLSLPSNAFRLNRYDPKSWSFPDFLYGKPYADVSLMQQYESFIVALQQELSDFLTKPSSTKWTNWDEKFLRIGRGCEAYRGEEVKINVMHVVNDEKVWEMRRIYQPILPMVEKTDTELEMEREERAMVWWRFMGRELMKRGEGSDVGKLGGKVLAPFVSCGVFGMWEKVKEVVLEGFGGYGGVAGEGVVKEGWGGDEGMNGNGNGEVVDMERERLDKSFDRAHLLLCWCKKDDCQDVGRVKPVSMPRLSVWEAREQAAENGEEKFKGCVSTSGCGYQWDF